MKTKSFFSIFIAMAIVPLALAFMVLKLGWFTAGATAKGQFVDTEITLQLTGVTDKPMWFLVFQPSNNNCDQKCEEQLYGLNQTYTALGKLQKRVSAIVLNESTELTNYPLLKHHQGINDELDENYIYLVDPFGKVVLKYAGNPLRENTISTSKDILLDIKKLLNYARVG
jgi:hypothetical protein